MGVNSKKVLLAVGLATFTGVALYLLYKKNEEDDELESFVDTATSRHTLIEMRIPRNVVGFVIGREGSNIKEIQEITNTRINFKNSGGPSDDRVCVIRGKADNAQEAERLIQRAIAQQPKILTINISVPQRACGRIIGRNGDTIRELCAVSGAKIIIDRDFKTHADGMRLVTIKGTEDQLATAKQLIQGKVEEEEVMRRRIDLSAANRAPRHKNKPADGGKTQGAGEPPVPARESLVATGADGYLEVYVSAVDTPGHFWVQVKSPRAIELDKVVERMTEFYSEESNRDMYKLQKVTVGDVVAAPFPYDNSWYRAEVTEVAESEADPEDTTLSVYYVDFGDTDTVRRRQAAELRTDFLGLSHQAVECFLAGIKPTGCSWTDAAGDSFEELTHAAQWKSIMAKVVRYQQAGSRKVPVVELIDTNTSMDRDVAKELVKQGHAVWQQVGTTTAGSREASPACS